MPISQISNKAVQEAIHFKDWVGWKVGWATGWYNPFDRLGDLVNPAELGTLVKIQGEFVWHDHQDTDDVFIVIDGEMEIELRDRVVPLRAGEMFVVPKGVEHRPRAERECHVLLVEPRGVVNTGNAGGALTAPNDVWV